MHRNQRFVFIPSADLVFYMLSSGEYDELAGKIRDWGRGAWGRHGATLI
jgi:hypothetical protein